MVFGILRRAIRRIARIVKPAVYAKYYIYELVVSGVVLPFTDDTRKSRKLRYDDSTLLQWECTFEEFTTMISDPTAVERRYVDDIKNGLLPLINAKMIDNKLVTYRDEVEAEILLRMPLSAYFKEWVRKQLEQGKLKVPVTGVGKLEVRDISATLKEVVEVEQDRMIRYGVVSDEFEFVILRPEDGSEVTKIYGQWEHAAA